MRLRTYSEMIQIPDFKDRFEYLKLEGVVGTMTFGYDRYINQSLYRSYEWKKTRQRVIIRDDGCDLAHPDYPIPSRLIIHHINPITKEMIENRDPAIFDMNNLVCVSPITHEAIHYGDEELLPHDPVIRKPGDTKLW